MPNGTAIIVCDMWDTHHRYNAAQRVVEIAPRINEVLEKARGMGVLIVHSPSSCMGAYKDHPARKNAKDAPAAKNLPRDIGVWCNKIPAEDKERYPIDQSDGGCDSDPIAQEKHRQALIKMGRNPDQPWKSQIATLKIHDQDIISDSGTEVWNVLESRGVTNIIVLGVHVNMCVLGRPFGLRATRQERQDRRPDARHDRHDVQLRIEPVCQPLQGNRAGHRAHREVRLPDDYVGPNHRRQAVPVQGGSELIIRA